VLTVVVPGQDWREWKKNRLSDQRGARFEPGGATPRKQGRGVVKTELGGKKKKKEKLVNPVTSKSRSKVRTTGKKKKALGRGGTGPIPGGLRGVIMRDGVKKVGKTGQLPAGSRFETRPGKRKKKK